LGFTRPLNAIKENWNSLESAARIEGEIFHRERLKEDALESE
jgi:hypothetical protein